VKISDWIKENWLDAQIIEEDLLFLIPEVGKFLIIAPKNGVIFDEEFNIILSEFESALADSVDFLTFCFGGKWYYFGVDEEPTLNILKYLGNAKIS